MQYGFVIDQDACIGCHACTVACKSENEVPVGKFRTSVKYVESGVFPDVKRNFLVQRCNHCSDAPCVTICPVNALEKRPDGIVDIDRDACIGCRACMQACPYDAIYLNEDKGAVEKCHFCAHRVEVGLEPACAVVCPVNAIIAGDMSDPNSAPGQVLSQHQTVVRRPEQETGPNVHYKGADPLALYPGRAERPPMYMWSDRPPAKADQWPSSVPLEPDARVVLDVGHEVTWGWPVAAYLVTKGLGAGAGMVAPFLGMMGVVGFTQQWLPEIIGLVFTILTLGLLVEDLARPWRVYRMLTRPNWSSWLVKGGVVLSAYVALLVASLALRLVDMEQTADVIRWLNLPVAFCAAGYTALLFRQCKGRDLWEGRWLLPHLLFQAGLCGAVILLAFSDNSWLVVITIVCAIGHLFFALIEGFGSHPTENAKQAAGFLVSLSIGPFKLFRDGLLLCVIGGVLLSIFLPVVAWIPVLLGLLMYEHTYIRAGQMPPLS